MRHTSLAVLLALLSLPPLPAQEEVPLDAMRSALAAERDKGWSGTVAIGHGGDVLWSGGFGLAEREPERPAKGHEVTTVGSITKQFTGAAILALMADGELTPDEPIALYFDDVPEDKLDITLHHLLTHTSGLPGNLGHDFDAIDRELYVEQAMAAKLEREPGSRYEYSNLGYSLLAIVVEKVTGEDYEAFLRRRLFDPLELAIGYAHPSFEDAEFLIGYDGDARWGTVWERIREQPADYWHLRGNGGLHASAPTMVRWMQALTAGKALPPEQLELLWSPFADEGGGRSFYGYGWVVQKTRAGETFYWHDGGNPFFSAIAVIYPDRDLQLFVTSNHAGTSVQDVMQTLQQVVEG